MPGQLQNRSIFLNNTDSNLFITFNPKPYIASHLGGRYLTMSNIYYIILNFYFLNKNIRDKLNESLFGILSKSLCYRSPLDWTVINATGLFPQSLPLSKLLLQPDVTNCTLIRSNSFSNAVVFFLEMHRFEDIDLNPPWMTNTTLLEQIHEERFQRLKGCKHSFIYI